MSIERDDVVKRALDYLSNYKEEMTTDKKYYTEVLIKEVKRLREDLEYQEGLVRYIKSEILKVIKD